MIQTWSGFERECELLQNSAKCLFYFMMALDGPVSRIYSRDLLSANFSEITTFRGFWAST